MDWGLVTGLGLIFVLIGVAFFTGKKVEKATSDSEKAEHKSDVADAKVDYANKQTEIDREAKNKEDEYWRLSSNDRADRLKRLLGGSMEGREDSTSDLA